ncbi:MAG: outer membrane lipoprotein-sorting protein [Candidatus Latescibacter sp.]|nr:outer membrane lipoprotein-sorting protein [Candidatus Latescibacter sp.]
MAATAILEKSQQAFNAAGADMKAEVSMVLTAENGKKRTRALTMLRLNMPGGAEQKYFLYFREPSDVRRMTFLVWKYPEKEDDRWIYIPAVDLVRRVATTDKRSSFVGSDFTYEDISGRDISTDTHKFIREEKLNDSGCYVIESAPKETIDYVRRVAWIDKITFLPLKEEYYDLQNELARVFTADKIEQVAAGGDGHAIPTVTVRTMKNVKSGHRTEVAYRSVSYNIGLTDEIFTERYLRRPISKWIQ